MEVFEEITTIVLEEVEAEALDVVMAEDSVETGLEIIEAAVIREETTLLEATFQIPTSNKIMEVLRQTIALDLVTTTKEDFKIMPEVAFKTTKPRTEAASKTVALCRIPTSHVEAFRIINAAAMVAASSQTKEEEVEEVDINKIKVDSNKIKVDLLKIKTTQGLRQVNNQIIMDSKIIIAEVFNNNKTTCLEDSLLHNNKIPKVVLWLQMCRICTNRTIQIKVFKIIIAVEVVDTNHEEEEEATQATEEATKVEEVIMEEVPPCREMLLFQLLAFNLKICLALIQVLPPLQTPWWHRKT